MNLSFKRIVAGSLLTVGALMVSSCSQESATESHPGAIDQGSILKKETPKQTHITPLSQDDNEDDFSDLFDVVDTETDKRLAAIREEISETKKRIADIDADTQKKAAQAAKDLEELAKKAKHPRNK